MADGIRSGHDFRTRRATGGAKQGRGQFLMLMRLLK